MRSPTGHGVRGLDKYGSGAFGASRDGGTRIHKGVDFIAEDGQLVIAPCDCWVQRFAYPYGNNAPYDVGVVLQGRGSRQGWTIKMLYVDPLYSLVLNHKAVREGDPIGVARSLQDRYHGITDHVHLEISREGAPVNAELYYT